MLNTYYLPLSVHHLIEGSQKVAATRAHIKSSHIRLQDILEPLLDAKGE